jgi:hypothetical protein
MFGGDPGLGWGVGDRVPGGVEQLVGGVGGVQVVVEQAVGGGVSFLVGVQLAGQVGGVGA